MSRIFILLGFLLLAGAAWAQTACPTGIAVGSAVCGPSPYEHQYVTDTPSSGLHWETTWGAIAGDGSTGDIGTSVGKFSRRRAKREAMAICASRGAKNCKIQLAYHNQCAAIAGPSEDGKIIAGMSSFQNGSSIENASQVALSTCSAANNGATCLVDYSDCTAPVLVRD